MTLEGTPSYSILGSSGYAANKRRGPSLRQSGSRVSGSTFSASCLASEMAHEGKSLTAKEAFPGHLPLSGTSPLMG